MRHRFRIAAFVFISFVTSSRGNLFTGVENLKRLSQWEDSNVDVIEEFVKQQEQKIQLLKL